MFAFFCFLYGALFYLWRADCSVDNLGKLHLQALGQRSNSVANSHFNLKEEEEEEKRVGENDLTSCLLKYISWNFS